MNSTQQKRIAENLRFKPIGMCRSDYIRRLEENAILNGNAPSIRIQPTMAAPIKDPFDWECESQIQNPFNWGGEEQ